MPLQLSDQARFSRERLCCQLEEAGVKDIRDIAGQTPGLQIKSRGETEGSVFIRGIGSVAPGIGADPAAAVAVEDSPTGVKAARAAGLTCIGVPSDPDHPLSEADHQVAALTELLQA